MVSDAQGTFSGKESRTFKENLLNLTACKMKNRLSRKLVLLLLGPLPQV